MDARESEPRGAYAGAVRRTATKQAIPMRFRHRYPPESVAHSSLRRCEHLCPGSFALRHLPGGVYPTEPVQTPPAAKDTGILAGFGFVRTDSGSMDAAGMDWICCI